ncbi:polysaccharide deacetylase family protein [Actinomadura parmotrematis]|uniref:Polysaccharide deacetylase family protein n=1 Tax=Actinomadura parmotrematis TaxID=2864039 RepID=A0ABS7FRK6_9ACTN|nr:polysaccharide deacetylase family protein [Actinomadura parmotrematis]MBW8483036.1 polysaccharide deacetylase family protein [Actinomadura parmotrematis]
MGVSEPTGPDRRTALALLGVAGLAGLAALGADTVVPSEGRAAAWRRPAPRARAAVNPAGPTAPAAPPSPTPPPPPPPPEPRMAAWSPRAPLTSTAHPVRYLHELTPPPPPKSIALTIDDGPSPLWTPRVLDLLDEHGVKATFFIIGEQVEEFPKLTRRIADAGHQVCNHTMTHPDLSNASARKVKHEIVEAHDKIAQVTGVVPSFFRAPGGGWSHRVYDCIAEHKMVPIDWSVDPRDWSLPGVGHIRRTMLSAKADDILLCHDGGGDRSQTFASLKTVIPALKKRGLAFVAL